MGWWQQAMQSHVRSKAPRREAARSGVRRVALRVAADLNVVVARQSGAKQAARVTDLSVDGMHLQASHVPEYGERIMIVARLGPKDDWVVLPATVRWFSRTGFGVAFQPLSTTRAQALASFVESAEAS